MEKLTMSLKSKQEKLRILIIDDNPEIHKDFNKILKMDPTKSELDEFEEKIFNSVRHDTDTILPQFQIDTASQGQEGFRCVEEALKEGNPYALAFVDIRMPPGWDGIETIKHIWKADPDMQIVICTAYSDYSWEETIDELGQKENLLILKKPFDSVAVRQLACALTKKWQLMQDARSYTTKLRTEVKVQTDSLQKSLSLVKATLESSNDGILVINNEGQIIDYNQKFVTMWQVPRSILTEKNAERLYDFMRDQLESPELFSNHLKELQVDSNAIRIDVIKLKDAKIFEYYTQPQKVQDETVGRVFDFRDITNRIILEKNLEYQATHDVLTGLPNRVLLFDKIKQAMKISAQNHSIFSILFIDLDRFKLINDSLSHAVGDEVLKITSNRLQAAIRAEDTLARLGGDEFIIILSDLANENSILNSVRHLQNVFTNSFSIDGREITMTASIGISIYPKDGTSADLLLRNADAAMYRAKEQHGNSFQFYTDALNVQCLAKLEQEMQLRQAVTNNELFLCYQPQVDIKNGQIVAAEALLRWNHPKKGLLLPLDFIQLAEETGLIVPIGEWVLYQACAQNKAWQDAGLPPIRVAVNVTAQQFIHQNMVELVRKVLDYTKLDPQYLELELTENVILSNSEIIKAVVELKKIGITIAIDDFGTGYSSLSYLKKIPLDRLKIDSSFIQHIKSDTDDEVIIRAVIAIANNLNFKVLAEGVETEDQLNFLRTNACGDVQGFYFSKPLTVTELEYYLRNPSHIKTEIAEES